MKKENVRRVLGSFSKLGKSESPPPTKEQIELDRARAKRILGKSK